MYVVVVGHVIGAGLQKKILGTVYALMFNLKGPNLLCIQRYTHETSRYFLVPRGGAQ